MKTTTLPVSRLTLAMLRHQYGAGPIHLDRADIRRKELMHTGPRDKDLERKHHALSSSVELRLNTHEAEHIAGKLGDIGYYMYQQDKLRIFQFVWARVTAGLEAKQAIHEYYERHGIEDDDFGIDTAERLWKRWRKKKEKERTTNPPEVVPSLLCVLFSERQAKSVAARVITLINEGYVNVDPRYKSAIEAWALTDLTPLTFRQVAYKIKRDVGNVGHSVIRLRSYIEYNDDLRKVIGYCLKTTKAQPTPSTAS